MSSALFDECPSELPGFTTGNPQVGDQDRSRTPIGIHPPITEDEDIRHAGVSSECGERTQSTGEARESLRRGHRKSPRMFQTHRDRVSQW